MILTTRCVHCGKIFPNIPESYIGKRATCKACKKKFIVQPLTNAPKKHAAETLPYEVPAAGSAPSEGASGEKKKINAPTLPFEKPGEFPKRADASGPDEKGTDDPRAEEKSVSEMEESFDPAGIPDVPENPESGFLSGLDLPGSLQISNLSGGNASGKWEPGEIILGLYEIKDVFQSGAMGAVYRVRHIQWDMDLVVKKPLPEILARPGGAENFEKEAETWIDLGLHPNIVTCYYVRRIDEIPHLFAEYIDGGDLSEWIETGRLYKGGHENALERIFDIAIQFARGLSYAHARGIIHQDVKPGNVMMTADGVARITDFGLSASATVPSAAVSGKEAEGKGATMIVDGKGLTREYASPEQFAGSPLTRRSDLWSWGLSLLQMFTGELSWQAGPVAAMALDGYLKTGPEKNEIPPMPKALSVFLTRCFQDDPDKRPGTMDEAVDFLIDIYSRVFGKKYPRPVPETGEGTAEALNNRALSLVDLGREDDAVALFQKALQAEPHHPESTYNRGLVLWRSGKTDDHALVQEMTEVLSSHPNEWLDDYLLGLIHLERGDAASALSVLEPIEKKAEDRMPQVRQAVETAKTLLPDGMKYDKDLADAIPGFLHSASCIDDEYLILASSRPKFRKLVKVEIPTGRQIWFKPCENEHVTALCTNPGSDFILGVGAQGSFGLYDKEKGSLLKSFDAKEQRIEVVSLTPDNRFAIAGSNFDPKRTSDIVSVWDLEKGKKVAEFGGSRGFVRSIVPLSDNRRVLVLTDTRVAIFDIFTGKILVNFKCRRPPYIACIDRDEKILLTVYGDGAKYEGVFMTWDLASGTSIDEFHSGKKSAINACFFPDNQFVLAAHNEGLIRIWDLSGKRCLTTIPAHDRVVRKTMMTSSGEFGVSVGTKCGTLESVKVWRLGKRRSYLAPYFISRVTVFEETMKLRERFQQCMDEVSQAFDEHRFGDAAKGLRKARSVKGYERNEKAVRLWTKLYGKLPRTDFLGGWEIRTIENKGQKLPCFQMVTDGSLAVVRGNRKNMGSMMLEPETGAVRTEFKNRNKACRSFALSGDGKHLLTGDFLKNVELWDTETGERIRSMEGHSKPVHCVCMSDDCRFALSGGQEQSIFFWDVSTGRCIHEFPALRNVNGIVTALKLLPDGKQCISVQTSQHIKLWDLEHLTLSRVFQDLPRQGIKWLTEIVAVDVMGKFALIGNERHDHPNKILMVEIASGKPVKTFTGHDGGIYAVAFSFDGKYVVSGGEDYTVRLWDISTETCLRTFEGHDTPVLKVALSRDNRMLVSEDESGVMKTRLLDWELEDQPGKSWDDGVLPYIHAFLDRRRPYAGSIPADRKPSPEEIKNALNRSGTPVLNEDDFHALMRELGDAGFGYIPSDRIRLKINEAAAEETVKIIREFRNKTLSFFESISDEDAPCKNALDGVCQALEKMIDLRFSFDDAPHSQSRLRDLCIRMKNILEK